VLCAAFPSLYEYSPPPTPLDVYSAAEQQGAHAVDDCTFEYTQRPHSLYTRKCKGRERNVTLKVMRTTKCLALDHSARDDTLGRVLWGEGYSRIDACRGRAEQGGAEHGVDEQ
jgi:hypothetical protein